MSTCKLAKQYIQGHWRSVPLPGLSIKITPSCTLMFWQYKFFTNFLLYIYTCWWYSNKQYVNLFIFAKYITSELAYGCNDIYHICEQWMRIRMKINLKSNRASKMAGTKTLVLPFKTNKIICAPNKDSEVAFAQSDQSHRCPHEESLGP